MEKPAILAKPLLLFSQPWVNELVIILLVTLVIFVASFLVLHYLQKRHARSIAQKKKQGDDSQPILGIWGWGFFEALAGPLYVAIWVVGIIFCLELIDEQYPHIKLIQLLTSIRSLILIAVLFWFLQRFVTYVSRFAMEARDKHKMDITTIHALTKVGRLITWLILVLAVLQEFGVPLSGVVAFGGGSAIVVGIAAKDLLANFFGGWVIIMDKPFKVGDWIASPDQEIEGTVEYIGWRSTRILSLDRRPLYVPNSVFTNITISNPSRMYNRKIKQVLNLRYEDAKKIMVIAREVEAMLIAHPGIDQSQKNYVNLTNFSSSSLDLSLQAFTKATAVIEFQRIQEDVMLKALEIVRANQADIASSAVIVQVPDGLTLNNKDV